MGERGEVEGLENGRHLDDKGVAVLMAGYSDELMTWDALVKATCSFAFVYWSQTRDLRRIRRLDMMGLGGCLVMRSNI